MAKVELKKPVIDEISANIDGAQSVVLVDHRGLTVAQDTDLRKQLREAGVFYKVYKNTMMNFAFKDTPFEELTSLLDGPSAIAVSKEDATAPARILADFAKTAPILEFKGGVVEGKMYDANEIMEIAKIPSRDELLSKLLGSIQSPIANFARVIQQIAESSQGEASQTSETSSQTAEAPAEGAPAEAPAEEAPAEAPAEETPAEAPVEEVPAAEAPAEEAPAEEAPAAE